MGFDEGRIILNSKNVTYYAGQTIYGKLIFQQDKIKTFRGLYVKVKGFCKVHWTTTHSRKEGNRDVTYHKTHESYEEYFKRKVYLLGSENGNKLNIILTKLHMPTETLQSITKTSRRHSR